MAWDKTKPANDELLINFPALCRANWDALELLTDTDLQITNAKVKAGAGIEASKLDLSAVYIWGTFVFTVGGTLTTGVNKTCEIFASCALTIDKVYTHVKTAPTGAAIIVDVNKNGTTIFTNQANRPQIAAGSTEDESGTPDVTILVKNDALSIDIDQGDTGADLSVFVRCKQLVS